jgi:hypothetical protein
VSPSRISKRAGEGVRKYDDKNKRNQLINYIMITKTYACEKYSTKGLKICAANMMRENCAGYLGVATWVQGTLAVLLLLF